MRLLAGNFFPVKFLQAPPAPDSFHEKGARKMSGADSCNDGMVRILRFKVEVGFSLCNAELFPGRKASESKRSFGEHEDTLASSLIAPLLARMILIFVGSTDLMSAEHTSRFLVPFLLWLHPQISFKTIMLIQLIVRKGGHVDELWDPGLRCSGACCGTAGWLLLRSFWRPAMTAFVMAVIFAMTDEFHQSFLS